MTPRVPWLAPSARDRPRRRRGHPDEVATPKVLHEVAGRPLLGHVLAAVRPVVAAARRRRGRPRARRGRRPPGGDRTRRPTAVQDEQRGTGHAVRVASPARGAGHRRRGPRRARRRAPGDTPLLTGGTLAGAGRAPGSAGAAATVLTGRARRPDGLRPGGARPDGRGHRASSSTATRPPTSSPSPRSTSGIYAFDAESTLRERARAAHHRQRPGRGVPHRRGRPARAQTAPSVGAVSRRDPREVLGVNDRVQLADRRSRAPRPRQRAVDARRASRSSTRPRPGSTSTSSSSRDVDAAARTRSCTAATTVAERRRRRAGHHARRHRGRRGARRCCAATCDSRRDRRRRDGRPVHLPAPRHPARASGPRPARTSR